jgi:hypothetical protein
MQLDPRCFRAVNLMRCLRLPGDPLVILTTKINMFYAHHVGEFSGKGRWRDAPEAISRYMSAPCMTLMLCIRWY